MKTGLDALFRLKSGCWLGLSVCLVGCSTEDTSMGYPVPVFDTYYIRTATDSGTVYLGTSQGLYGPQGVGGEKEDTLPFLNEFIAWRITGEDTVTLRSENNLTAPISNLVVRADDGLMRIEMVDDADAVRDFSDWRLVPLDNGHCHIVNESLGSDLALTISNRVVMANDIERYSVEMSGVDDSLNQHWTIIRDGNPPGNHEQLCGEVLEEG